jgi:hypothetical protein
MVEGDAWARVAKAGSQLSAGGKGGGPVKRETFEDFLLAAVLAVVALLVSRLALRCL